MSVFPLIFLVRTRISGWCEYVECLSDFSIRWLIRENMFHLLVSKIRLFWDDWHLLFMRSISKVLVQADVSILCPAATLIVCHSDYLI